MISIPAGRYRMQLFFHITASFNVFQGFSVALRSFKWMKGYPGIKRDIEVIRSVRDLIGPESMIAIAANNGYTFQEVEQVFYR